MRKKEGVHSDTGTDGEGSGRRKMGHGCIADVRDSVLLASVFPDPM